MIYIDDKKINERETIKKIIEVLIKTDVPVSLYETILNKTKELIPELSIISSEKFIKYYEKN